MAEKTLVLHVRAAELNDALSFNRLKGDLKKMVQTHRLAIVHSAGAKASGETQNAAQILTLNKTFAAKLSEELMPAIALAAHHLGIATMEESNAAQDLGANLLIKPDALSTMMRRGSVPVIAPIVRDKTEKEAVTQSEWIAAKVAAAIHADLLIFLIAEKDAAQAATAGKERDAEPSAETTRAFRCAKESLRAGAKRAFVTDIGGMENIALRDQSAPTEIFDHNP